MIIYIHLWPSHWIRLRMKNVRYRSCSENHTHVLCSVTFSRKSLCLWSNMETYGTAGQATDENIIQLMHFACWFTKATDTHSEYVMRVTFPLQPWLRTRLDVTVINIFPVLLDCVRVLFHSVLGELIVVILSNLILDHHEDSDEYLFVYLTRDYSFTVMFMVCIHTFSVNLYKMYAF
jgi:hypothetical protein